MSIKKKRQHTHNDSAPPNYNRSKEYPLTLLADQVRGLKISYDSAQKENAIQQAKQLRVQILLCVFTALGFIAAIYYASIARHQWKTAEDTLVITERAYVALGPLLKLTFNPATGAWQIPFSNYGHVPSSGVMVHVEISTQGPDSPSGRTLKIRDFEADEMQIPSGEGYLVVFAETPLSDLERTEIFRDANNQIKRLIALNGVVRYKTGFGRSEPDWDTFQFCMIFSPDPEVRWVPCPIRKAPKNLLDWMTHRNKQSK